MQYSFIRHVANARSLLIIGLLATVFVPRVAATNLNLLQPRPPQNRRLETK